MNYEKELLRERVKRLERKSQSKQEITFYLNDYTADLDKTYYFCFEHLTDGYLKIEIKSNAENLTVTLGDAQVVCGESFYLEKGVFEFAVNAVSTQPIDTIYVRVSGEVAYYDGCETKVLIAESYSVIAQFSAGLLSLYKYDTEIKIIEQYITSNFDIEFLNGELTVYRIVDGSLEKAVYLEDFSASVVTEFNIDGVSQVKCSKSGLYIVISGTLYLASTTDNGIETVDTGIRVKELLAIQDGRAVYRDFDGKIKLCSFSVSP